MPWPDGSLPDNVARVTYSATAFLDHRDLASQQDHELVGLIGRHRDGHRRAVPDPGHQAVGLVVDVDMPVLRGAARCQLIGRNVVPAPLRRIGIEARDQGWRHQDREGTNEDRRGRRSHMDGHESPMIIKAGLCLSSIIPPRMNPNNIGATGKSSSRGSGWIPWEIEAPGVQSP
jgi:hypothetical protein